MKRFWQRGDTLIEVTIALAILSSVLISAFVIANRAFQAGLTASERSQQLALAQRQAELLTNFRDSHTWDEFLNGVGGASGYNGINVRNPKSCNKDALGVPRVACFHMVAPDPKAVPPDPVLQPYKGALGIKVGGGGSNGVISYADIRTQALGPDPNIITFVIAYGTDAFSSDPTGKGVRNTGQIYLTLSNVDGLRQQ